jgi:hypothetical protein
MLVLTSFDGSLISLAYFRKILPISNFMEIRPVGAELFHADGQTDGHDAANSLFSQFCQHAQRHVRYEQS